MAKRVRIVYFSGTGGTTKTAESFAAAFRARDCSVSIQTVRQATEPELETEDLLVLLFSVHAFNAPAAIYRWLDTLLPVKGTAAAVISVSAGGEIPMNSACRRRSISRLTKRGYDVFYENMIIMPSNWMVATEELLALQLLDVLPRKAAEMSGQILAGERRRTSAKISGRIFSTLGEAEKFGAQLFGRRIKVSDACNGCGWCAANCHAGNIEIISGKPVFGKLCNMCLGCLYGCPTQALRPGLGQFILIKEGYRLDDLLRKLPPSEPVQEYDNEFGDYLRF